jgi:hypothetical protein
MPSDCILPSTFRFSKGLLSPNRPPVTKVESVGDTISYGGSWGRVALILDLPISCSFLALAVHIVTITLWKLKLYLVKLSLMESHFQRIRNYLFTPWSKAFLEKLTGSQLVKKFHAFCGEGSLPHSQVSATCPYPEPARSGPHPHILLNEDPS